MHAHNSEFGSVVSRVVFNLILLFIFVFVFVFVFEFNLEFCICNCIGSILVMSKLLNLLKKKNK